MGSRIMRRVTHLCAALLVTTVVSSGAIAQNNQGTRGPTKQHVDLVIGGEFVVTIDDARPVIRDGAVAVKDGRVVAVGTAAEINAAYQAPLTLPGEQRVLMPGLVNGHTHAAMVLFRGIADDLALSEWLTNFIFPAERMFVDADFVRTGTQLACWEMIRGGTTTFVDMYFHSDVVAEVVEACGLRAIVAQSAIDFPSPGFLGWDDSFAAAVVFVQRWKGRHPRITPAIGPHAPYTVAPEHLVEAVAAARQHDVPITIHVAETQTEVNDVLARYGNRPVQHLDAIGFLEPRVIAAHVVWPDAAEIAVLAQRKVGVIHNPTSNLKLASGVSPVPQMLAAGVKVGLGTDGAASNNNLDMWQEINLAALIHKAVALDPTTLPAATVLRMATLGGAQAIGLGAHIGAITVGRQADLIQVRLNRPHLIPLYDVISHLVYAARADDVTTVVVDGTVVMLDGAVLTLDLRTIQAKARRIAREIADAVRPARSQTP
jgi:5-methylthioadenosine/S-adenosylhomocysteine deaminase